jgi:hypothetical protein
VYVPIQPEDGVLHSVVLPGFQFRLEDLGRLPEQALLRSDPVYAHFVLPGWRAAEERAATEAQARLAAEQRADTEAQARRLAEDRAREAEQALTRLEAQLAGRQPGQ